MMRVLVVAKKFRDLNTIVKHFQTQLDKGNTKELETLKPVGSGMPVISKARLQEAANKLRDYLRQHITDAISSYSPSGLYQRTGDFINSVDVELINDGDKTIARVFFDEKLATRHSLWEGQPDAYLPAIYDDQGFQVKNGWHKDIYRFGYWEGADFINAALADTQKDDLFKGIEIVVNRNMPF